MAGRPRDLAVALGEANTLRREGNLAAARKGYRRVLAVDPRQAEALNNGGIVAFQLGKVDEALELLGAAVAVHPGNAEAHNNLALVLLALGHVEQAATACRRALTLNPWLPDAHFNLGHALLDLDRPAEAAEAYDQAARLRPDAASVHFQLGLARHAAGELAGAIAALERSAELEPTSGRALYGLGNVLQAAERLDEAASVYGRALDREPALAEQVFGVGKPRHVHALLRRGDAAGALAACHSYLDGHPGDSCALAHAAVALGELGDSHGLARLHDFERLVRRHRPRPPKPHRDIQVYNRALEAHIRAHPSLIEAPASFSIEGGRTTGELLVKPLGPMNAFQRIIREAVEGYIAALPDEPSHPFVARAPRRWRATVWAIIIGPGGHQVPHIHPSGWLSAVYYLRLPSTISPPGGEDHGWIEFGRPYRDVPFTIAPATRRVRPEEGLMLLFPSYMFHGTLPYPGAEERISISFDILPLE